MNRRRTRSALVGAVAVLGLVVTGCGYDDTPLPEAEGAPAPAPAAPTDCENVVGETTRSVDPADYALPGQTAEEIRGRRLRVGISADTYLMASANPEKNNRIEGFDIEIVKRVAQEIFGAGFDAGRDIEYHVITAAERIPLLEDGTLDMVVRNMTITCDRWDQVAFSAEYYHATQKVLVRKDLDDGDPENGEYTSVADLAGLRVCAPTGSTSLTNITDDQPEAIVAPAPNHTGCLVKFQNGEVDAITGDDTVLAGLAAQDPYASVPADQPAVGSEYGEPYGVAVGRDNEDLAAFVNAVLEEMRQDGSWQRAYNRWLGPYLGGPGANEGATQPEPVYGR